MAETAELWARQPQDAGVRPSSLWQPKGLWLPAYGTALWTPNGMLASGIASSGGDASPAGPARTGDGSATFLNWTINLASAFPLVIGGVFQVTDTTTTSQFAVGIGDSATTTGGLYGGVGQITSAGSVSAPQRMSNGGSAAEPTGPTTAIGRVHSAVRISRAATDHVLYVDGLRYTSATNVGVPGTTFGNFSVNASRRLTTILFPGKQKVALGFYGTTDPGDDWLKAFSLQPWATIFEPRRTWNPVVAAAGFFSRWYYEMIGRAASV